MTEKWAQRNIRLLEYLREKARESCVPRIKRLCREFIQLGNDDRTVAALEKQISRNGSRIQELDYETVDKVRMIFMLFVPVTERFLQEIQQSATVVLDRKNRIHSYEAKDGSLKLERNYAIGRESFDFSRFLEVSNQQNEFMNPNLMLENLLKRSVNSDEVISSKRSCIPGEDDSESCGESSLIRPKIEPIEGSSEEATTSKDIRAQSVSLFIKQELSTETTQAIQFLKQLESLVGTLNSPQLSDLQEEIEEMIQKPQFENLMVPSRAVTMALESALHYVVRNSTMAEEESTSLKEFLLVFRATTFHLADYSGIINEIQSEEDFLQKKAPFAKIKFALRYAIGFVLP